MAKNLTIGSLKYGTMNRPSSFGQSVTIESPAITERIRVIEMKQNQRYFQIEVKSNQSILEAAIEKNLSLNYKCKKGTCGKCKVTLVNGSTYLQPANSLEEKKLHHLIQSGFRLACQARAK